MKRSTKYIFIIQSILIVLISILIMSELTSAWFNTDVTYAKKSLIAANFEITSTVSIGEEKIIENSKQFELEPNTYRITLKRTGTSKSEGYCLIKVGESFYQTESIKENETVEITLTTDSKISVSLTPMWGQKDNTLPTIKSNEKIEIDIIPDEPLDEEIQIGNE